MRFDRFRMRFGRVSIGFESFGCSKGARNVIESVSIGFESVSNAFRSGSKASAVRRVLEMLSNAFRSDSKAGYESWLNSFRSGSNVLLDIVGDFTREVNVFDHDGDTFGVKGFAIGIFEDANEVSFA